MHLPPITRNLLILIGVVFLLQQFFAIQMIPFMLWPFGEFNLGNNDEGVMQTIGFQPWQLVTYGFMHDPNNIFHIIFNSIALYQFGSRLEYTWGGKRYLSFFLVCVVGAGLCQLIFMQYFPQYAGPTIGASGGVYGLLLGYGMLFPKERVMLLIPPIPMSAKTLVIVFGALSLIMGITGTVSGIAHFAHLGGMLFGWLLIRYWRGQPPFKKQKRGPWGV